MKKKKPDIDAVSLKHVLYAIIPYTCVDLSPSHAVGIQERIARENMEPHTEAIFMTYVKKDYMIDGGHYVVISSTENEVPPIVQLINPKT